MIYTVTMNPTVDIVVSCPEFRAGRINYYSDPVYSPGGKGINVSLVLKQLGMDSCAMGICAGFSGDMILETLPRLGIEADFLKARRGNTRINLKVSGSPETELNGKGEADPGEAEAFLEKLARIKPGDWAVLSGSLPEGIAPDFYARILARLPEGVLTVVDAAGERLLHCLRYRPFLIKPNREELSELFSAPVEGPDDAARYGKRLQELGAKNVLVSLGSHGAVLVREEEEAPRYYPAPKIEAVSSCGAGDSMVAGVLYGYLKEHSWEQALSWGIAAGAATAASKGLAAQSDIFTAKTLLN